MGITDTGRFVEAKLTGVTANQKKRCVDLFITDTSSQNWHLVANEVQDFMVIEMRLQNIIDRMILWGSSDEIECRRRLFCMLYGYRPSAEDNMYLPTINNNFMALKQEGYHLLEIEPVFGALIFILAKHLQIEKAR